MLPGDELLLEKLANPQNAAHMLRFFKTGPGQYSEGDRFLGIKIPQLRNRWDLVDSSAIHIVGQYLKDKDHEILIQMARTGDLWQRRIAVIATFTYIKASSFDTALKIIEILINDPHDPIQKATGWMLREIGKRDLQIEEDFLDAHAATMPRTMAPLRNRKILPRNEKTLPLQKRIKIQSQIISL